MGSLTGIDASKWYDFFYRGQGDDDATADLEMLRGCFGALPLGSNLVNLQEPCLTCDLTMPGLCFPARRRNSEESEFCHACRIDEGIFYRVARSQLVPDDDLRNLNIGEAALTAMGVHPYPYIKAPLNTRLNTVCPFLLNKKACPHSKCPLRAVHAVHVSTQFFILVQS